MALLHLVRHGRAVAGFGEARDPGLDPIGMEQARAVASSLAPRGPLPILVSPLRRTRETAAPLEEAWGVRAEVEPRIAEIPAPSDDLEARAEWLRRALRLRWSELGSEQTLWREDLIERLRDIEEETVVVTHFVAINAVVGLARGADDVVVEMVGNGSITVVSIDAGGLEILEVGGEGSVQLL